MTSHKQFDGCGKREEVDLLCSVAELPQVPINLKRLLRRRTSAGGPQLVLQLSRIKGTFLLGTPSIPRLQARL
jgi:hypothetical protein